MCSTIMKKYYCVRLKMSGFTCKIVKKIGTCTRGTNSKSTLE